MCARWHRSIIFQSLLVQVFLFRFLCPLLLTRELVRNGALVLRIVGEMRVGFAFMEALGSVGFGVFGVALGGLSD
jgi:hypothetical protein